MKEEARKFKQLIEASGNILVTAHISPDADAVSSVLLMGAALMKNYPSKSIEIVLEEEPSGLNFLEFYDKIVFKQLDIAIDKTKPDLIILLDANNFDRASRHNGDRVRELIKVNNIKTIVFDHHEIIGKDEVNVFINNHDPASAQTVYVVLFNDLGLVRPSGAVNTAMAGYYADTGGFKYLTDGQKSVFGFVEKLVQQGADIEKTWNQLQQFTVDDLKVIAGLFGNVALDEDYTYSFLSDDFITKWLQSRTQADLQRGVGEFLDSYIRNIAGRDWGFIVFRNTLQGENMYSVSLRSVNGVKDVSLIANRMDGGGHKGASGAKVLAQSVDEAIKIVRQVIAKSA